MGDTPAPAISSEAIYKTADMFYGDNQKAANLLKNSSYVDDVIDSFSSLTEAQHVTSEAEKMLNKGGFVVKCWQFGGNHTPTDCETSNHETQSQNVKNFA
ncbi:hypothetical protein SNE40_002754 [Patella caerulea]|uniref:Uncharacterized protein n=1 Tax=Patella caerulea TaxID=87958 RepID=A0AAN8KEJ5_PATCE